jgi:hypothetical protein
MVLQLRVDLLLDLGGQTVEISRPLMTATDALHHDDGEASYDEHAAVVMTIGTDDRERAIRIRHGRGDADRMQSLRRSNDRICNWLKLQDLSLIASRLHGWPRARPGTMARVP